MAYEPHEWQVGDKITSARLNNIEQGIVAANSNIVTLPLQETDGNPIVNVSYNDIVEFLANGKMVFIIDSITNPYGTTIMPVVSYWFFDDNVSIAVQVEALDIAHDGSVRIFEAPSRTAQLVEHTESDSPK